MELLNYVFAPEFLSAALTTILLTVLSMALGIVGGFVLSILVGSRIPPVRWIAHFYIWLFRGTPVLLQLVFVFSVLPLVGLKFDSFTCAIIALSLNEAAYMAEIIRGGRIGVDKGQAIAAGMLGLSKNQIARFIVIPQLMRLILPPTGNQLIGMLKTSALASVIAVQDLMLVAQRTAAGNFDYLNALSAAAIHYLILTTICTIGINLIENRLNPEIKAGKRRGGNTKKSMMKVGA